MMVRGENEEKSSLSLQPIMKKIEEAPVNGNRQQTAATMSSGCSMTSLKSNSSSSSDVVAKDNNNADPCWDSLPSVILLEIFSYLPQESRIQASQVCRYWRYALFHPSFWKKITFTLMDNDSILWSRCLSSWFKFSVQDVTIRCESANNYVREALFVLKKLSGNRQLRKVFLEPIRCMFEYPTQEVNSKKLLKQLLNIMETSNCLEALSLGCIEELTEDLTVILEPLKHNHANHLTHLSLASIKDDPEHYNFLELDHSLFNSFARLSILSIDYDHVIDNLLQALNSGTMERLVIHVHGWSGEYVGTSNNAWIAFTQKNPRCELRLNLIHSYSAVRVLDSEILQSAMPLTHLKVLFCERVNVTAFQIISDWYSSTLKSLIWIDSFNYHQNHFNSVYNFGDLNNPDPLVLAAWKCKNLSEIVFIGHEYFLINLAAIVRLRHNTLKRFEFAESDIVSEQSWMEHKAIINEVKEVMGKQWKLLSDEELPKVVIHSLSGDSREVIMPMVLRDQK
ncbi:PREDICTED: F-box only protein 33 [Ceratosolen solmsi marchali]|uniref:F-box only protein 33 n=1 Tax=Ceratosolen solmsi marchali TaxID=326594 RepID=A0AAJ6VKW3_9HYME|nr:PREDICTED: F-box only protein 33 [Ceratosolen solmsi marchali]XP_011494209.1 PREDICTED: F-box only protein 33 [Ceratosolen solmsi marchali]XP_011494210.1 PREDICTED: F-box only protein 33 [Ceratosolen solmsi marchali]XP_011494211.1 PREDICTED: F-box only protein 33 [Ceratosolen solmsi marchali]